MQSWPPQANDPPSDPPSVVHVPLHIHWFVCGSHVTPHEQLGGQSQGGGMSLHEGGGGGGGGHGGVGGHVHWPFSQVSEV